MSETDSLAIQNISPDYVRLLGECHYVKKNMPDAKMPRNDVPDCICETVFVSYWTEPLF